jgi:L-aminopeptidase/D-esterase-like protein
MPAEDGEMIGGPHGERDELLRSAELIAQMPELPGWAARPDQSTTLACVCTDAALDKRGCGIVARIASAGIARAVDPAFTLLAAPGPEASWSLTVLGTAAAAITAAAIRDAVRQAAAAGAPPSASPS